MTDVMKKVYLSSCLYNIAKPAEQRWDKASGGVSSDVRHYVLHCLETSSHKGLSDDQ